MATKMEVVQNMMRLNKNNIVSRDILKLLADQCIKHGYLMTEAQLKVCAKHASLIDFVMMIDDNNSITALGYVLTLREPIFLETFLLHAFAEGSIAGDLVCRYLRVCTPEAARNVLKDWSTCYDKKAMLLTAYEERENVFEYALWDPFGTVEIVNEYGAAWYILTGYKDVNIHGLWSNKQLKRVFSRPEAIDRYAQIEYIEYDDVIHIAQSEIIMEISAALTAKGAKMTLFHNSYELAEEGIRMNNCIGTYWQHDAATLLFSVDYKDHHMDVEVGTNYYGDWEVFQVLEKNNAGSQITTEVFEIIADTVYDFSKNNDDDKPSLDSICAEVCDEHCEHYHECPFGMGQDLDPFEDEEAFYGEDIDFEPQFEDEIDWDDCEIVDANEAGLDDLDLDFEF